MKGYLVIVCIIANFYAVAQDSRKFTLIDEQSETVIPFANIVFDGKNHKGTSTDIDGVFYVAAAIKSVSISSIGYETKRIILSDLKTPVITLKEQINSLDEIIISSKENPAHRIIKSVVANSALNNPANLEAYTYKSYDKIIVDSNGKASKNDSLNEIDEFLKNSYFFITENIVKHKYLKPRFSEDSIIATRTSGLKNPNFAVLANAFQPFSFYDEYITLLETNYLNPISKGSTRKYKFRLQEEYLKTKDTIFVISFEPEANRNFEGLKGLLYINSNHYAVESVDAATFSSGKINFTIQQKYKFIEGRYWFPEQLNFEATIGDGFGSFKYIGKNYISETIPNAPLTKKDFPFVSLTLPETVAGKDSEYWELFRQDTLTLKEKRTYVLIDSIGEDVKLDKLLALPQKLMQWRFPLKYVDLDLLNIIRINQYENLRLGLGVYTNDALLKNVSIGAFAGYGFKDNTWKYGGSLHINVPGTKDIAVSLKYQNSIREVGSFSGNKIENPFTQRAWIASQMDAIEAYSIRTDMKLYRNINWFVAANTADVTPLYSYEFVHNANAIINYTNTEISVGISYHVNEKLSNTFGVTTRIDTDAPVFNFIYSKGLTGTFDGDFRYNKLRFTLDHSFITKGIGKTTYRLDLGYIDKALPYGLLFTGEGTLDNIYPFIVKDYFQTVTPYEFLSNQYAHLFTTHNLGRLLHNKGYFQPDVLVYNNLGVGSLDDASDHQGIAFSTKEHLFLETGLELDNILKVPYFNIGYMGVGIGAFYRYGNHHLENSDDNWAFKFSFGFTFK